MASSTDTVLETSRRNTRQREAIYQIVRKAKTHPTAEQVHRLTQRTLPAISLATVYRNLHLLVEAGKIREVQFRGDVVRYDGMVEPHEHFYCHRCGSVTDLPGLLPQSLLHQTEQATGSRIDQYALDYYGTCSKCLQSR